MTRPTATERVERFDSVVIREVLRDTVVRLAADSALVKALLECDSLGRVRMRELVEYRAGERLRPPKVIIRDNIITVTAQVDSTAIWLRLRERFERRTSAASKSETVTIEVNRLTWWQKLWIRIGWVLFGALVIYIIFKVKLLK